MVTIWPHKPDFTGSIPVSVTGLVMTVTRYGTALNLPTMYRLRAGTQWP